MKRRSVQSRSNPPVLSVVNNSESETVALSDVERLSEIFGIGSGRQVTEKSAIKLAIVYACCRLIAGAIAQMPKKIYEDENDSKVIVRDDPLKTLLNLQPTPTFTAAQFWEYVVSSVLLKGDSFAIILRDRNGNPIEILPVNSAHVLVKNNRGRLNYHILMDNKVRVFDQDDVLHFSNFGFDGLRAPSVIRSGASNSVGLELAMEDYSVDFFENGSHQSIVLTKEGAAWSEEQKQSVRDSWLRTYGRGTKGKNLPIVLDKTVGLHKVSVDAKDAQLLESREFQITDIARAFGLPSFMVNQEQKNSSWGSGVTEIGQVFLRYTLSPHNQRFEQELNRKFFLRSNRFLEFSTAGLIRATIKDRYESYKVALGGNQIPGFLSVNDVRRLENQPILEGDEYNRPYMPPTQGTPDTNGDSDE